MNVFDLYSMDADFESVSTEERIKQGEIVGISLPEFTTFAAQRGGRGSNGYERDRGAVLHAVPGTSTNDVAYGHQRALCGLSPGRHSTGWSCTVSGAESVSCLRCLKRMAVGVRASTP